MAEYTVVFFWNYLNHHQVFVADEMYRLLGEEFHFVATLPRNANELKGGMDYSSRPYCILAGESDEAQEQASIYAKTADVCVFGACSQQYALLRESGLSFECGERWMKRGWLNLLSPVLSHWWRNYMRCYRRRDFYKLCSGAYTAHDDEKLGCYKGKHYKWGYFTDIPERDAQTMRTHREAGTVRLMWCARFIDWKHPEMVVDLANRLRNNGYLFHIDMYGEGPLKSRIEDKADNMGLAEYVSFKGSAPNDDIQKAMHESDIFLFTSDKQEGWGVVANEAMANGCCLVGADEIGAVPYLIRDGVNGLIFRSKSLDSLYDKVKYLLDDPAMITVLANRGYEDMFRLWSPKRAAESLMILIDDLTNGRPSSIVEGPCSKA